MKVMVCTPGHAGRSTHLINLSATACRERETVPRKDNINQSLPIKHTFFLPILTPLVKIVIYLEQKSYPESTNPKTKQTTPMKFNIDPI